MKTRGFTLIELLAVIVILAVIALIAVPIILNIIESSKRSAVIRSGELYLDAVEQAIMRKNLEEEFKPTSCEIQSDGNLVCDAGELIVETDGDKPTSGTINFENGKITTVEEMQLTGYVLEKNNKGNLHIKGTSTGGEAQIPDLNPQGGYLMSGNPGNGDSTFFEGEISKASIESVTITNTKIVPSDAIDSWDVSEDQDESIMAWYFDEDQDDLYELYIGGEGGVKANPDSSGLFANFTNVTEINLTYLDPSDVTIMIAMFQNCEKLESINFGDSFDASKVTNMQAMFFGCNKLENIDLSSVITKQLNVMTAMFANNSGVKIVKFGDKFDTSQVTNTASMFQMCNNLTEIDFRHMDFTNVTVSSGMFGGAVFSNGATIYVKDQESETFINEKLNEFLITGVTIIDVSNQ